MVASYLLDAGERNHNLDELAQRYLGHTTIKISELIGSGQEPEADGRGAGGARCADYAGEDAWLPVAAAADPGRAAGRRRSSSELFAELEMPLIDVLVEMEFNGIKVDVASGWPS